MGKITDAVLHGGNRISMRERKKKRGKNLNDMERENGKREKKRAIHRGAMTG